MTKAINIDRRWIFFYAIDPTLSPHIDRDNPEEIEQAKAAVETAVKDFSFEAALPAPVDKGFIPGTIYMGPSADTADKLLESIEGFYLDDAVLDGDRPGVPYEIEGSAIRPYVGLVGGFIKRDTKRKRFHHETAIVKTDEGKFVLRK